MPYVYRYTCPLQGVVYIGKGIGNRAFRHLTNTGQPDLVAHVKWLRSQSLEPIIDFICVDVDEEFASLVEQEAIRKYGRRDLGTGTLLNRSDGAGASNPSALARRRMSEGAKSMVLSEETRRKKSDSMKRYVQTEEQKANCARAVKAALADPDVRKRMSDAAKLRWKKRKESKCQSQADFTLR